MINFIDDDGKEHNIGKTGEFIPKSLKLDPTKSPLKYRSVEFKKMIDEMMISYLIEKINF